MMRRCLTFVLSLLSQRDISLCLGKDDADSLDKTIGLVGGVLHVCWVVFLYHGWNLDLWILVALH